MDIPSENSSFFMCTLCAKVFMTKDEAAKHVCPKVAVVAKEQGKNVKKAPKSEKSTDDTLDDNSGWTIEATNNLIDLYKEMKEEKGRVVWSEIAAAMKKQSIRVSGYQCEVRFSIIKNRYHRIASCLAKGKASSRMTAFPYLQALSEVIPVKKPRFVRQDDVWNDDNEKEFLTVLDAKMFEQSSLDEKEELSVIWADISDQLKSKDIDISPTNLELHWVSLVREYKGSEDDDDDIEKTPKKELGDGDGETSKSDDADKDENDKHVAGDDGKKDTSASVDGKKLGEGDAGQSENEKDATAKDTETKKTDGGEASEKANTMKHLKLIKDIIQFFPEDYIANVRVLEAQLLDQLEDEGVVGCVWRPSDTQGLLALIKERKKYFNSFLYTKKSIWKDIAKNLCESGHTFTGAQAEGKWKSLKARYRKATKAKEDGLTNTYIPFYNEITEVYSFLVDGKENERNSMQENDDMDEIENVNDDYEAYKPVCVSIWHNESVRDLLYLIKERKAFLANAAFSKKSIWKDISKNLKILGYDFNAGQAEGKWKSLKTKYRRMEKLKTTKGERSDMPFYEEFKELYTYLENEHPEELPTPDEGSLIRMKGMDYAEDDEEDGDTDTVASRYERAPAPWSTSATKVLLQLMMDRKLCFAESKILRKFFDDISSIMNKKGFDYDGIQCQSKWKTMRRAYKKVLDHNALPNTEPKRIPFQDTIKFLYDIREEAEQDAKAKKVKPKKRKLGRFSESDTDEEAYEQEIVYDAEGCPVLWNTDMTNHLISNYKDVYLKVKKGLYNGKMFWKIVHNRMRRHGHKISVGNCKDRFQGLRETYQKKSQKVARGLPVSWQYYNDIQMILNLKTKLGKQPLETSTPMVKSHPIEETLNKSKHSGGAVWDDKATASLLAAYEKRKEKFLNAIEFKRKDLWEEISKELEEINFHYSAVSCNSKFKTLLRAYRNVLKSKNVNQRKKLCPFYDELSNLVPVQLDAKTQREMYETLKRKGEQLESTSKKSKQSSQDNDEDDATLDDDQSSNSHIDASIAEIVKVHEKSVDGSDAGSKKDNASSNGSIQEMSLRSSVAPPTTGGSSEMVVSFSEPTMGEHGYSAAKDEGKDTVEEMDLSAVGEDYVGFALSDEESVVNKPTKPEPESPSLANQSGQMMQHMFTWLQRYEDRQERREHDMFNRMERMQSETLDVMKNLITIIAQKKNS